MRDTRVIVVEVLLVLILTALVQPELVRLGSTARGNVGLDPPSESAVTGAAATGAGRDTKIRYVVSRRTRVAVGIYELNGRQVRRLSDLAAVSAGPHTVTWDGRDDQGHRVSPGVYYYRLSASEGGGRNTLLVLDR
jgi:hypothetical protein